MKATKIVTEIEKLNKLGILKKTIVIKKGKDEDVAYLADTYIAAVNTLADDEIPEDVAKFYNELGDEIDAKTLVEKEEVLEEVVAEKKPAKAEKKKEAIEKEAKKPIKKEVTKAKETKKEVAKEKPAKIVAKGKTGNKENKSEKKEPSRKFMVYQAWLKKPKTNDKIYELAAGLGLSILTAKGWVNQWNKGNNLPAGI
jgi:hypothetical protein